MSSPPIPSGRHRTTSFACIENVPSVEDQPKAIPQIASDETIYKKSTRFRRNSFALSGERQTTLDDLVDSAFQQVDSVAAHREAATLGSLVSPVSPDGVQPCVTFSLEDEGKRVSVATLVPKVFPSSCSSSDAGTSENESKRPNVVNIDKQHPFIWYNNEAFQSNPLTSDLIMKYLAALAVEETQSSSSPQSPPPAPSPVILGENIPGLLSIDPSSVASMTMPVQRIRWAHKANTSTKHTSFSGPCHQFTQGRHEFLTDYAHLTSDSESWCPAWHNRGYISDSPADFDPKNLHPHGRLIDTDFHLPGSTFPRSPKKQRSRIMASDMPADSLPSSPPRLQSKFDVSRVYEGLPYPRTRDAKLFRSTVSLDESSPQPCMTPPSTPNSQSSRSSTAHSLTSSHGLKRLRSLFDHLKPDENSEQYIYMDEKTQARRAKAQASNVISPVSF